MANEHTIRELTSAVDQIGRHLTTVIGQADRLAGMLSDFVVEMRVGFRALEAKIDSKVDSLEVRMTALLDHQRREMTERFAAVGRRFDEVESRMDKLETQMRALHTDMARMEQNVIAATRSALSAHGRIDGLEKRLGPDSGPASSPDNPPDPS